MLELLERSADVTDVDDTGSTPLLSAILAAGANHASAVRALLDAKADVCAIRKSDCMTPLMAAASLGDVQMVDELVRRGADVQVRRKALGSGGQGLWRKMKRLLRWSLDNFWC